MSLARPYLLKNPIQHYVWGMRGDDAFIPGLLGLKPEPDTPYAELWMGAHASAPSEIQIGESWAPLDKVIADHPLDMLGSRVFDAFGGRLPYLFKVLSADQPLSIQAHPNRAQAEELHRADPEHYPDANPKPEIAIALDTLHALVGLKSMDAFAAVFSDYPELAELIGEETARRGDPADCFRNLLRRSVSDPDAVALTVHALEGRFRERSFGDPACRLFLESRERFPESDVGLLAIFLLNDVMLGPGEGVFIDAGVPHAYVRGNLVECMINSDNVVRVGLTPKFKDVPAMLEILRGDAGPPVILGGAASGETVYEPLVDGFRVVRHSMKKGSVLSHHTQSMPEIYFVIQGEASITWAVEESPLPLRQGQSVFIPACLDGYRLRTQDACDLYRIEVKM